VAHGRSMGSLMCVDITQAAGLLPFDVMKPRVDFVVSTSLKWMCGTPGAGIFYVDKPLISDLTPEIRGWFSQNNPFSWDLDKFEYAPDIRRFDKGTPGSVAVRLVDRIIARADDLGLPLHSPRDGTQRGGSMMLRMPNKPEAASAVGALGIEGYSIDFRGPLIRLSPGYVTDEDCIDEAFDLIGTVMQRRQRRFAGQGPNKIRNVKISNGKTSKSSQNKSKKGETPMSSKDLLNDFGAQ